MTGTNSRGKLRAIGAVCMVVVTIACGDDDDDSGSGACGTPACGGDVQGEWQVSSVCAWDAVSESFSTDSCPNASGDARGLRMTGPVSFTAGGNYTSTLTLSGSIAINFPGECLTDPESGIRLTCSQLDMAVGQALTEDPESPFESVSCTGSSSCRCTMSFSPMETTEAGTYSTSGNRLTMIGPDGEANVNEYCVTGNSLVLRGDASAGNDDPALVLTR